MGLCLLPTPPEDAGTGVGLTPGTLPLVEPDFWLAGMGADFGLTDTVFEPDLGPIVISIGMGTGLADAGLRLMGMVIDFAIPPISCLELLVMTMDLLGLAIMVMPLGPALIMMPFGLPDTPILGGVALPSGLVVRTIGEYPLSTSMISMSGDKPARTGRGTLVGVTTSLMGEALVDTVAGEEAVVLMAAIFTVLGAGFGGNTSTTLTGTIALHTQNAIIYSW